MLNLLLVEDDPLIGQGLELGLQQRDFNVEWVTDGLEALSRARKSQYDCLLLDLNLPQLEGMEILRRLREAGNGVSVIIITAMDAISSRIDGLNAGADDYVVKPVAIDELVARIQAVYRRKGGQAVSMLKFGEVQLDPIGKTAFLSGDTVNLSSSEFKILQTLLEHGQRVVTREKLEHTLYGYGGDAESNTIEVHIHNLRKKFGKTFIKTLRGLGYVLQ